MLLYENKKQKLLTILKMGINPFVKFVATGEIKEDIGLVKSRKNLLNSIQKIIDNNETIILPIIGKTGVGKTHLYWALKNKLYYHNTIYISLENYKKFYYNIYSEFMEEMGPEVLRSITNKLCNEWGALERKFGFFHVSNMEKIRSNALEILKDNYEDKIALNDVINAISAHQLDSYKNAEAERWLLGELMDFKDLSHLNLLYDLSKRSYAYTILKIVIENFQLKSVLFIDDFEKIISLMKPKQESDMIFGPEWLYGDESESPDQIIAQKVLEKVLNLQKIEGLRIIITLNSIQSLEKIKKSIEELNKDLIPIINEPLFLSNFTEEDLFEYYLKNMEEFLISINYLDFLEYYPKSYFPLNKKLLNKIYNQADGNPREIIKSLIKTFNQIIYSEERLDEILKNDENF